MKAKGNPEGALFPDSAHVVNNEMVGIKDSGYIDKKGVLTGMLNALPPGMDIDKQTGSDIRPMKLETYSGGMSFPGDGW